MENVDWILSPRWLLALDDMGLTCHALEHRSVVIDGGKIIAIDSKERVDQRYQTREKNKQVNLSQHVLLPGLVNAHTHLPMSLLRGLADDLPLMRWLEDYIWPKERKWVSQEFVRDGAMLAIAELIRGGVTCFNEMYFYEKEIASVAHQVGIRGRVAESILDFEMPWSKNGDVCIEKVIELIEFVQPFPLVKASIAPHSPYATKRSHLEKVRDLSEKYHVPVHIHLQETFDEVEQFRVMHKMRPTEYLAELGLITPMLQAVHMTQANSRDMDLFKKGGAHIIHCPESNMKLASGSCPVHEALKAGINVALGTDGSASNNDLDMFGEMRSAAFMAKLVDSNPEYLPATAVLKMATRGGAKALGFGQEIGSIEVGKAADVIAVDLDRFETLPVYHPTSQLVYAACREQVTDVWVNGQQLLKNRVLTTIDEQDLRSTIESWRKKIK
jgi:5-methylthioadenosine/S-adenosylhomocysteine deaminase